MNMQPIASGGTVNSGAPDPDRIPQIVPSADVEKGANSKVEAYGDVEGLKNELVTSEEASIQEYTIRKYCSWSAKTIPPELWEYILSHMQDRSFEEWLEILRERVLRYEDDDNVPGDFLGFLKDLADGHPIEDMKEQEYETVVAFETYLIYDWSVYPQVRSCTKPYGWEESEDYENFRTYFLSLFWAMAACSLDTFFYERQPPVTLSGGAIQILMAGTGKLWALLPRIVVPLGWGRKFVLNSGKPWSYREQMFGSVVFAVSIGCNWAEDVAVALSADKFFGLGDLKNGPASFGFVIMAQLSFALTGFGLAGIMRTFFVYPEECVFYDSLYLNTLGRAITEKEPRERPLWLRLTMHEMFWVIGWANFLWYWVTNVGFQALSQFGWMTWIDPNNVDLNAMTGVTTGLALNPLATFDPNVVGSGCTFFYIPWRWLWQWTTGYLICTIAIIIMWYTNVRFTKYLPINTAGLFDNEGQEFNVSRVLNDDNSFNTERYQNYSQPYFSAGFLLNYGVNFMYMPAVVVWMILYKWKLLVKNIGSFAKGVVSSTKILENYDDRFSREMKKHPEAPEYWYGILLCVGFGLSIATVEHWGFVNCPVWTLFVGAAIAWLLLLPANTLRSTTTYFFSPQQFLSIIFGLALDHNGTGNLFAQYYAYCFTEQTDNWVDNQKIAHYSGIKPRAMFRGQLISTVLTSLVMSGIMSWQAGGGIPHFCEVGYPSRFYCVTAESAFNNAVGFGTIGSRVIFEQIYPTLKWTFLLGALYPIPFWVCKVILPTFAKRYPEDSRLHKFLKFSWLQGIHEIVILNAGRDWGQNYNWMYYFPNFYLGAIWHFVVEKKYPRFWNKYSYIAYQGVSVGIAFAALFVFFATQYHHHPDDSWWGNNVVGNTLDANSSATYPITDPRGYFGPDRGTFRVV